MILDAIFLLIGLLEKLISVPLYIIDKLVSNTFPQIITYSDSGTTALGNILGYIHYFNGIIPTTELVNAVVFIISVWITKYLFKWAIALFNATPWIKIIHPKGHKP